MALVHPPKIYTVSDLTAEIRALLEDSFSGIWVEGELSNFRHPSSGHMYFTLKDQQSQVRVVMFRVANRQLKFQPRDGLAMLVYGAVSVYEPRGEYQIVAEYMEPRGLGALQLAFEQLKERLQAEGLFDEARKRPIPLLPRRIGVITSPTGAAIRDILQVLHRRFANVDVLIHPVLV
ncbi:MAG: exodeoxyribonuclease VII large subunit, partial [Candidatus Methylomirabilis sp.]